MARTMALCAAVLSLAICLAAPIFFFLGRISTASYRNFLLVGTLGWFICAALLLGRRKSGWADATRTARASRKDQN